MSTAPKNPVTPKLAAFALGNILDRIGNTYAMHPADVLASLPEKVRERFVVHPSPDLAHFSSLGFLRGACRDLKVRCDCHEHDGIRECVTRTEALRDWLAERGENKIVM